MITYTIPQLDHMIDLAQQLGFWDDVEHGLQCGQR